MTLLMYKKEFYRILSSMRAEFFRIVETGNDTECLMFLRMYAEKA